MAKEPHVENLVVDAGGFIKNAAIKDIGVNIWTVQQVVQEIRDKATRQRLQVLPYELQFREPSAASIKAVTDFSKKTGDYASLSAVDMRVLALVYQLEQEHVGCENIRTEPAKGATGSARTSECSNQSGSNSTSEISSAVETLALSDDVTAKHDSEDKNTDRQCQGREDTGYSREHGCSMDSNITGAPGSTEDRQADDDVSDEWSDDEDSDDGEGWITPSNLQNARRAMGAPEDARDKVKVACLTTDFAMQNVLLQMGLSVVSVMGSLIKHAKTFTLRCFACMKMTSDMTLKFCPVCGNSTLRKVAVSVGADGTTQVHLNARKQPTTRGTRFSLPAPRGGKHNTDPVLCPDQLHSGNLAARSQKLKYNPLDPDYVANQSPFAPNDLTSRAAVLGVKRGGGLRNNFQSKRNPNENRKFSGRRK